MATFVPPTTTLFCGKGGGFTERVSQAASFIALRLVLGKVQTLKLLDYNSMCQGLKIFMYRELK